MSSHLSLHIRYNHVLNFELQCFCRVGTSVGGLRWKFITSIGYILLLVDWSRSKGGYWYLHGFYSAMSRVQDLMGKEMPLSCQELTNLTLAINSWPKILPIETRTHVTGIKLIGGEMPYSLPCPYRWWTVNSQRCDRPLVRTSVLTWNSWLRNNCKQNGYLP